MTQTEHTTFAGSGGDQLPGRLDLQRGTVVVAESGAGRFAQTISAGRHRLVADEPVGVGDDTGPTPYDLLLAALGACTSMTIRMYADCKGWPLEHVSVQLRHDRVHADDCREPLRRPCTAAAGARPGDVHTLSRRPGPGRSSTRR